MEFLILTVAAIAIVMLIMAVGVIFKRPCLRGSCGGAEIFDADGEALSCGACPRRKERAQELSLTSVNAGAVCVEPPAGAGKPEACEAVAVSREAR
jgi:hypothetical protein